MLPKTTWRTACNDVLILFLSRLCQTELIVDFWTKITLFFGHFFPHGYYDWNAQRRYFNHLFWNYFITRDE